MLLHVYTVSEPAVTVQTVLTPKKNTMKRLLCVCRFSDREIPFLSNCIRICPPSLSLCASEGQL